MGEHYAEVGVLELEEVHVVQESLVNPAARADLATQAQILRNALGPSTNVAEGDHLHLHRTHRLASTGTNALGPHDLIEDRLPVSLVRLHTTEPGAGQ